MTREDYAFLEAFASEFCAKQGWTKHHLPNLLAWANRLFTDVQSVLSAIPAKARTQALMQTLVKRFAGARCSTLLKSDNASDKAEALLIHTLAADAAFQKRLFDSVKASA